MKTIYFAVISDIVYDQRMKRICRSLAMNGFDVVLVGRKHSTSILLNDEPYRQIRLNCFFEKGKLSYLEFNLKLFWFLLFKKMDAICAIDLDTIVPVYFIATIKKVKRIYDAHELFCEMKEVVSRPVVYRMWKCVERWLVPKFPNGYTVSIPIANEFHKMYGVKYEVISNISNRSPDFANFEPENFILYQGAVNEGRCFETLIPAMQSIDIPLVICGDGNFMNQAKMLVKQYGVENKVIFRGKLQPEDLRKITEKARLGITLFENKGLSNYYSLANRFFDYIHAGIPQICSDYPAYRQINSQFEVALLIEVPTSENIAAGINRILNENILNTKLRENCMKAQAIYNWQQEDKKLLAFYSKLWA